MRWKRGFTLLELLVAIAILGILAALLFPALSSAKNRANRATCLNNLRQVALGVTLYADEHDNVLTLVSTNHAPNVWTDYKSWMRSYVGLNGVSSPEDAVFACPADKFHYTDAYASSYMPQSCHSLSNYNYSSYVFNAGNMRGDFPFTNNFPGIAGRKLTSIRNTAKTVLVAEIPALIPYSWHQPQRLPSGLVTGLNNAKSMVGFVDGHVRYINIFWDAIHIATGHEQAWHYDPPEGYEYKWSGD